MNKESDKFDKYLKVITESKNLKIHDGIDDKDLPKILEEIRKIKESLNQ